MQSTRVRRASAIVIGMLGSAMTPALAISHGLSHARELNGADALYSAAALEVGPQDAHHDAHEHPSIDDGQPVGRLLPLPLAAHLSDRIELPTAALTSYAPAHRVGLGPFHRSDGDDSVRLRGPPGS